MPAAIPLAVAGVTAAGGIINAKMQSNAAKRAGQSQERSASEAIGYQKSRDAVMDSRYDKKAALYNEAVQDWRRRNGGGGPATSSTAGPAMPVSLADLMGQQQGVAQSQGDQAQTGSIAANMGGWNDWQRYGA